MFHHPWMEMIKHTHVSGRVDTPLISCGKLFRDGCGIRSEPKMALNSRIRPGRASFSG